MRIDRHITMAGKMFCGSHYALALYALHYLGTKQGHFVFIFPKRTKANNGIVGIIIDIYHWCIIHLQPLPFTLHANGLANTVDDACIV